MKQGSQPGESANDRPFLKRLCHEDDLDSCLSRKQGQVSVEELRKRDGQWVAFSADGKRLLASAATIAELADQVRALREDSRDVVLEHIEVEWTEIDLASASG